MKKFPKGLILVTVAWLPSDAFATVEAEWIKPGTMFNDFFERSCWFDLYIATPRQFLRHFYHKLPGKKFPLVFDMPIEREGVK